MKYYIERFLDERAKRIIRENKLEIHNLENANNYDEVIDNIMANVYNNHHYDVEYLCDLVVDNFPALEGNKYLDYRHNMIEMVIDDVLLKIGLSIKREYNGEYFYKITVYIRNDSDEIEKYKENLQDKEIRKIIETIKLASENELEDEYILMIDDVEFDFNSFYNHISWDYGFIELSDVNLRSIYQHMKDAHEVLEEFKRV